MQASPMRHPFFLAPAGTGAGLTTVALGLVNALDSRGVRVAFFKPISQRTDSASGLERSTHFIRATTSGEPCRNRNPPPSGKNAAAALQLPRQVQSIGPDSRVILLSSLTGFRGWSRNLT